MRSRWTDFRTSDGEKPDRHRDQEFEEPPLSRAELMGEWEDGWRRVFDALAPLTDADLQETVYIRLEPHSIYKAIIRQLAHYAGHAYQILMLAKHLKGADWQTLSIPRGQSDAFNERMIAKLKAAAAVTSLSWGLLGTAHINRRLLPAMRAARRSSVVAVASRTTERAQAYARPNGRSRRRTAVYEDAAARSRRSTPSTFRFPTRCTSSGRCARSTPASMCCARSRWR